LNTSFIFQLDEVNQHLMYDSAKEGHKNISGLYDLSHGAGIVPENWIETPNDGIYYGYAGGLSPKNVAFQLSKIETLTDNTWVDAETFLRNEGKFDLKLVVEFLEAAAPWVK
jgi:phosphoribosylanthranilate isomerase